MVCRSLSRIVSHPPSPLICQSTGWLVRSSSYWTVGACWAGSGYYPHSPAQHLLPDHSSCACLCEAVTLPPHCDHVPEAEVPGSDHVHEVSGCAAHPPPLAILAQSGVQVLLLLLCGLILLFLHHQPSFMEIFQKLSCPSVQLLLRLVFNSAGNG